MEARNHLHAPVFLVDEGVGAVLACLTHRFHGTRSQSLLFLCEREAELLGLPAETLPPATNGLRYKQQEGQTEGPVQGRAGSRQSGLRTVVVIFVFESMHSQIFLSSSCDN